MGRHSAEGDLQFSMPFDIWCRRLAQTQGFSIAALEWEDVNEARAFPFSDPFDCLIAGTAARLGMPLITKDSEIAGSGLVETIW
jgi:PIN domain nuclease of toxin-antitoxin system